MTRDEAKEHVKAQLENYLQAKGIDTRKNFACLVCGKGNKTPCMSYKDNRIHCFSCGVDMDLIDLIEHETGKSGKDLFDYCYEYFSLTAYNMPSVQNKARKILGYKTTSEEKTPLKTQNKGYIEHIMKCKADVSQTNYFLERGLSRETIEHYNLGYSKNYEFANEQGGAVSLGESIVIPYPSEDYYIIRPINPPEWFKGKYVKLPGIAEPIYNLQALYNKENKPVFIVEGAMDALSVIEAGGEAVSLNGTGYTRLIEKLQQEPTPNMLIVSLDNDEPGEAAAAKLCGELQRLKANFIKANVSGKHKDANEALTRDKELFLQGVKNAIAKAANPEAPELPDKETYINTVSVTAHIQNFINGVKKAADTPAIPTNFKELDKVLDDGLYEGLYIYGAISSLGKTSLILQIADNIAQQGQDVLFFSLEMARTELMAKSISRMTFWGCNGNTSLAKTTRGITAGKRYERYNVQELELIKACINDYSTFTDSLFIHESVGEIGVQQIREITEKHIKITGNKPVVFIDYLQILAPFEMRATDKQNTDKAVFELKRLSRDLKIPVVAISSLNRENYTSTISMAAFKESGAIEYSSDVLIGLQFAAMGEALGDKDAKITAESINRMKRQQPRKIELKILKNRNGATGDSINFDYYPMFNYFKETGKVEIKEQKTVEISAKSVGKR